jgi:hypothetical protein
MNFDMKKYFYIDEQGNKKKYVGNITNDKNGALTGVLTKTSYIDKEVELTYVNTGDKIIDSKISYYYIDNNNEKVNVNITDNINIVFENDKYFYHDVSKQSVKLNYHKPVEGYSYYTYTLNGNVYEYNKQITFNEDTNTYYGVI